MFFGFTGDYHADQWMFRYTIALDYMQTQWCKSAPGFYETNRNLRGNALDTALKMTLDCEGTLWLIGKAPKRQRALALLLATGLKYYVVMNNAKVGAPISFYLPIVSGRF